MAEFNSIFPYGSPINKSKRSILAPGNLSTPGGGQGNKYGGPLVFGGRSCNAPSGDHHSTTDLKNVSSARRSRLFQASPYHGAATHRIKTKNAVVAAAAASSKEISAQRTSEGMSSTARLILDTLDKMPTPLGDARKMVVPESSRAEKRRAISERFFTPTKRRRPNLRSGQEQSALKGPPLRTSVFSSPVPNSRIVTLSVATKKPEAPKVSAAPSQVQKPIVPISFTNVTPSFGGGKIKSSEGKIKSVDRQIKSVDRKKGIPPKNIPPFAPTITESVKEPEVRFKFSAPSRVPGAETVDLKVEAPYTKVFTFSHPEKVPGHCPSLKENLPDFLKHEFLGGDPAPVIKKTISKGKYKLPDVTSIGGDSGFGGIKTASELKQGSVMSILGGFTSRMK